MYNKKKFYMCNQAKCMHLFQFSNICIFTFILFIQFTQAYRVAQ